MQGATEIVCKLFFGRYAQSICFKSYQEFVSYVSVALCAVSTSVLLRLSPFPPFLRVPYSVRSLVYYVIFWKILFLSPHTLKSRLFSRLYAYESY